MNLGKPYVAKYLPIRYMVNIFINPLPESLKISNKKTVGANITNIDKIPINSKNSLRVIESNNFWIKYVSGISIIYDVINQYLLQNTGIKSFKNNIDLELLIWTGGG